MELSSFQLENHAFLCGCGVVLNVSEDHLDRYDSYAHYAASKQVIYQHCAGAVLNRDDPLVMAMPTDTAQSVVSFGLDTPAAGQYGVREHAGKRWLAKGEQLLLANSLQ